MSRPFLLLSVGLLMLTACAQKHLPPALPADPVIIAGEEDAAVLPVGTPPVSASPLPQAQTSSVENIPVSDTPQLMPSESEWQRWHDVHAQTAPPEKPLSPRQAVAEAQRQSVVKPTRQGFRNGQSAVQRYRYVPDKVYEVWTSPTSLTEIQLPHGELLAVDPFYNKEEWQIVQVETGEGPRYQQSILVHPKYANKKMDLLLKTKSGLTFYCRLLSFEETALIAVSWIVPPAIRLAQAPDPEATRPQSRYHPPLFNTARFHGAYTLAAVKDRQPPWQILGVFDDGATTHIRFKELGHTHSPVLFSLDGKEPVQVQYSPYRVPDDPGQGVLYIAKGIYSQLELRGADDFRLRIIRQPTQGKPFQPVARQ